MIPIKTEECDWDYHLPGRPGEGVMPCVRDRGMMTVTSFWRLEEDDDLAADGINVQIVHFKPTVRVGFGRTIAEATLEQRELRPWAHGGGRWTGVGLSDEVREYLRGGGLFVLEVGRIPPPPVAVWVA